jgi:hypothetical protein
MPSGSKPQWTPAYYDWCGRSSNAQQQHNQGYYGDRSTTFDDQRPRARKRWHGKYVHRHRGPNGADWPMSPKQRLDSAARNGNEYCSDQPESKSLTEKFYTANKSPHFKRIRRVIKSKFRNQRAGAVISPSPSAPALQATAEKPKRRLAKAATVVFFQELFSGAAAFSF